MTEKTDKIDLFVNLAKEAIEADEALEKEFPRECRTVGFDVSTYSCGDREVKCSTYVIGRKWYTHPTFKESLAALREEMKEKTE